MRAPATIRPLTAGPDSGPAPPFPIRLSGPVIKGFGRGSKELQIPTANIPIEGLKVGGCETVDSGVYFGFAGLDLDPSSVVVQPVAAAGDDANDSANANANANVNDNDNDNGGGGGGGGDDDDDDDDQQGCKVRGVVFPMAMSIGWNPFFKNTVRSVEVHVIHSFPQDFYGVRMNLVILGFIRPEYDYVSKEALIEDIRMDIKVGLNSLEREGYRNFRNDGYLRDFGV